jgi:hypothetical protein
MSVSNRQYLDHGRQFTVEDQERKAVQDELANISATERPALRSLSDHLSGAVHLVQESGGYAFISRQVPVECRF